MRRTNSPLWQTLLAPRQRENIAVALLRKGVNGRDLPVRTTSIMLFSLTCSLCLHTDHDDARPCHVHQDLRSLEHNSAGLTVTHWPVSKRNDKGNSVQRRCSFSTCTKFSTQQCICTPDIYRCSRCMLWHISSAKRRKQMAAPASSWFWSLDFVFLPTN